MVTRVDFVRHQLSSADSLTLGLQGSGSLGTAGKGHRGGDPLAQELLVIAQLRGSAVLSIAGGVHHLRDVGTRQVQEHAGFQVISHCRTHCAGGLHFAGQALICVGVTVVVSMVTKPVPTEQLAGLVYGVTPIPDDGSKSLWQKPMFWAIVVITVFFILNLIFW